MAPLIGSLMERQQRNEPTEALAALFHEGLARTLAAAAGRAAARCGLKAVGLSGGVFCNAILSRSLKRRVEGEGLTILRHRRVPPNDGGLALGQAAVATAKLYGNRIGSGTISR